MLDYTTPATGRKIALGYVRRSMIQRGERTDSPEKQRAAIEAVTRPRGWTVEWFQDADEGRHFSGRTEDRPAWQALKAQIESGRSDLAAVVVNSIDRASRSMRDFLNFLELLQRRGIGFVSCTDPIDTSTAAGQAFLGVRLVFAAFESNIAAERTAATIRHRQNQGIHWGNTPYGYVRNGDGSMHGSADAPAVDLACRLFTEGLSYHRVAERMNLAGYRMTNRYGDRHLFDRKNVRIFVLNHWLYRGWLVPGGIHSAAVYEHDEAAPPAGVVHGRFPPLIEEETAERIAAMLRDRRHALPIKRQAAVYLLTPMLHCGQCGAQLRGRVTRGEPYYMHPGRPCRPGYGFIPARLVEERALRLVAGWRLPEPWLDLLRERLDQRLAEAQRPEQADVLRGVERVKRSLDRLRKTYVAGDVDDAAYAAERDELKAELRRLELQQAPALYDLAGLIDRLQEIGRLVLTADRAKQKEVLALIFSRLDVDWEGETDWRFSAIVPRELFRHFF